MQSFEKTHANHRYKKAIVNAQREVSYGDLYQSAKQLAHYLKTSDKRPQLLLAESSEHLAIALLAASMVNQPMPIAQSKTAIRAPYLDLSVWMQKEHSASLLAEEFTPAATTFFFVDEVESTLKAEDLAQQIEVLKAQLSPKESDCILLQSPLVLAFKAVLLLWSLLEGRTLIDNQDGALGEAWDMLPNGEVFPMDFSMFFFGGYSATAREENKYDLLLKSVAHGDQHAYSAVWTPERHFNDFGGLYPNPSVLSAGLATLTKQLQIRTGSIVAPLHHPVRIAEDWSIIDNLSNGRVGLSFASGWQCNDFIFYPDNYQERHRIMMEHIEKVQQLWQGQSMAFKNGLDTEIDVNIFPKPIQEQLPIWVTVSGKVETFIDAGRVGANILTHLLWQDTAELKEKIAAYRESLAEHGFDPASRTVSVMVHTFVGEDDEVVKELVRQPLKDYIRSSVHLIETMIKSAKLDDKAESIGRYAKVKEKIPDHLLEELLELAFERFYENAALLGSPEKCHQMLMKLRGYDVDELACLLDFGLDKANILKGLEALTSFKAAYERRNIHRYNIGIVCAAPQTLQAQFVPEQAQAALRDMKWLASADSSQEITSLSKPLPGQVFTACLEQDGQQLVVDARKDEFTEDTLVAINSQISEDY